MSCTARPVAPSRPSPPSQSPCVRTPCTRVPLSPRQLQVPPNSFLLGWNRCRWSPHRPLWRRVLDTPRRSTHPYGVETDRLHSGRYAKSARPMEKTAFVACCARPRAIWDTFVRTETIQRGLAVRTVSSRGRPPRRVKPGLGAGRFELPPAGGAPSPFDGPSGYSSFRISSTIFSSMSSPS